MTSYLFSMSCTNDNFYSRYPKNYDICKSRSPLRNDSIKLSCQPSRSYVTCSKISIHFFSGLLSRLEIAFPSESLTFKISWQTLRKYHVDKQSKFEWLSQCACLSVRDSYCLLRERFFAISALSNNHGGFWKAEIMCSYSSSDLYLTRWAYALTMHQTLSNQV